MNFSDAMLTQFLRDSIKSEWWRAISKYGEVACATYPLACCAILQTLGPEWSQKHIGRTEKTCDYFRANKNDKDELLRYVSRTTEFGELLYNLHGVAGFDERISSIRTDDKNGVESGIAELIAGKFFKMAGVPFHYVVMKPEAGKNMPKNPDIEYVAGLDRWESCEVKCNLEATELSERSIINILKKAKGQLPKDKAGIILLRIPETWVQDMESGTTVMGNAITAFIESAKSKRLTSIFLFVSETKILAEQQRMVATLRIKEFQNGHCEKRSGIVLPDLRAGAPNWRTLRDLAERELGRLPRLFVSGT